MCGCMFKCMCMYICVCPFVSVRMYVCGRVSVCVLCRLFRRRVELCRCELNYGLASCGFRESKLI